MPTVDTLPITLRVSDVVHFDGCRRKWMWGHLWTDMRFRPAFWIGSAIHAGLEGYYRNAGSVSQAHDAIDVWVEAQRLTWHERFAQTWLEVGGDDLVQEVHDYLSHYAMFDVENALHGTIAEDDAGQIIERRLSAAILDLNGEPLLDSNGNPVLLSGQCDLALKRNNGIVIVDHKSFGPRTMAENPNAGLDVDDQGTAYCYLFWRTYGVLPSAFIYNVIVKQHPQQPRLLNNGTLSMAKDQHTTPALYRAAIKEHGLKVAPYLNILAHFEKKGYEGFFQRWQSSRNMYEMQAFEKRLAVKARDIVRMVEDPEMYAYASGSSYRCGDCAYNAPCKAADDGGDALAILENEYMPRTLWEIQEG